MNGPFVGVYEATSSRLLEVDSSSRSDETQAASLAREAAARQRHRLRSTMAIVQRNVQIKASPDQAMALLSEASRWPDWYPGMTEIAITAPFPEQGGKVRFKVKSAGLSMPITETALEYQPGKLQLLQMEGMLSGRARWELTPEGDGTRLTTTFDYALPGGVLGRIADALIVKRMNAKSLEEALHNFKALVERQ
jgi:hypothetical protein